jgi:hypothetical protein
MCALYIPWSARVQSYNGFRETLVRVPPVVTTLCLCNSVTALFCMKAGGRGGSLGRERQGVPLAISAAVLDARQRRHLAAYTGPPPQDQPEFGSSNTRPGAAFTETGRNRRIHLPLNRALTASAHLLVQQEARAGGGALTGPRSRCRAGRTSPGRSRSGRRSPAPPSSATRSQAKGRE